jgi:hypothetical protein
MDDKPQVKQLSKEAQDGLDAATADFFKKSAEQAKEFPKGPEWDKFREEFLASPSGHDNPTEFYARRESESRQAVVDAYLNAAKANQILKDAGFAEDE